MQTIYSLSKLLLYPSVWIFIGFLVACLLSWTTRCSPAVRLILSLSVMLFYGFSTRPLEQALVRPLETHHRPSITLPVEHDAIVLFVNDYPRLPPFTGRPTIIGTRTADLLMCGINYVRSGGVRKIVLAEGAPRLLSSQDTGGGVLQEWAIALGYPKDALIVNDKGIATHERVQAIRLLLGSANRILLIDSAMHLTRSAGTFTKAGFTVTAIPCDYSLASARPWDLYDFIPSGSTLETSSEAVYEYFGLLAYWLRGFV